MNPPQPTLLPLTEGLRALQRRLAQADATLLLFGPSDSGQAPLIDGVAAWLAERGRSCHYLCADPGAPRIGVPAALNLARWERGGWQPLALEPLASLDAGRFRLPLVTAVQRLRWRAGAGTLLLEAPGVLQGVAAAELLDALGATVPPDLLVELRGDPHALAGACSHLGIPRLALAAQPPSRAEHRRLRRQRRNRAWDAYLASARPLALELRALQRLGTLPPAEAPERWRGALVALGDAHRWLALAEVQALRGTTLQLRSPLLPSPPTRLLVRDACRNSAGELVTRAPRAAAPRAPSLVFAGAVRALDRGPQISTRAAVAELVNGIYGDPLLLVQLRQSARCLLFDLGDCARVPLRALHRVSDLFISHAHLDHIGGFVGLLRARLGVPGDCRLYGPPGLAGQIAGFLDGVLWDRIADHGPRFEVGEVHPDGLRRWRLQAGAAAQPLPLRALHDGVLLAEPAFRVRTLQLDHGTPVLAFAFEPRRRMQVNAAALARHGWPAGPWLAQLKQAQHRGDREQLIRLPDGRRLAVAALADLVLGSEPGEVLVYATDLADHRANREGLAAFAAGCHTLFCEACFAVADRERAARHGHLTTRACAEIAAAAAVGQLVPFHFSRRYERAAEAHYREIEAHFDRVVRATALRGLAARHDRALDAPPGDTRP